MVVRLDSNDPPPASAAGDQRHGSDLTLNDPTSADFGDVQDLRLEPDVDSSSTLVSGQVPLERRNSVPPGALTQTQPPRADVPWPAARTGDADRSWWWRLPSLKASREKTHLRRSAHDEPATMEAISNIEKHLAALATLRDVCASIDQRLARAEAVSARRDGATSDEVLHDVCAQIYDRLIRVEATLQRTEGFVADKPWDVSTIAYKRLERVEETLRLTQQSLADSTLPEMCVNIERQLIQTRRALQRTEEAVADKTLRELCENMDARLVRTEETLRRTEGIVAEWLRELSTSLTGRFAEAEETIHRIERIVSSRALEQTPPQQPSVRMDSRPVQAEETARHLERFGDRAGLFLRRFVSITQTNRAVRLSWMARLAVPVLVLVTAFAIGALISTSRGAAPEKAVSLASTDQISTPAAPATREAVATPSPVSGAVQFRTPSTTTLRANAALSTRESRVPAPKRPSLNRESAPIATRPRTFVGTLSITSVPTGASVSINGKVAGVTPLKLPRQRAGSLAVQIARDGFERWSAAVRVPADRLTEVTARLRPIVRVAALEQK
jgi:hypothetical protein